MDTTTRSPLVTDRSQRRRVSGLAGIVGGIAWVPLVAAEGLGSGATKTAIESGFVVASACFVVMLLAVHAARPAGTTRKARVFTGILAGSWVALLASQLVDLTTGLPSEFVGAIGGLGQCVALVATGILAARVGAWSGWRRWWLLAMGAFFVLVVFVPAVIGFEPGLLTEGLWALSYSGLGLALLTES